MPTSVILSAVRLPIGKFQGSLKSFTAPMLGAHAVRAAVERAGIDAVQVDEVIMGCVLQAGLGQNPARQAALRAGLPPAVAALTVNQVCGSGLRAVMLAAQAIQAGDAEYVVAGGMESMTNAPYVLPKAREGYRMGHGEMLDVMIHDGLWCTFENWHMGCTAEVVAERYGISREAQDAFAAGSQAKAVAAQQVGAFRAEIEPVTIPQRKGDPLVFAEDEGPRADTTAAALAKLKPVFQPDGTVTAGNASTINDGAAAVVVTSESQAARLGRQPMARIVAQAMSGIEPKLIMMAPVEATRRVLAKAGWKVEDVDLFEFNEAFAAQAIAVTQEVGADPARVNVNGGAIALGHPIGASGARVLVTLLHALQARQAKRGVAALCLGGGNAVALAVERD
ncbi:acetyl-CoA C-acetyltransferase [Chloracidobacterium aggregatum]|jgi:acetyl-CoA C-acetyltransferase|uniref:Acetyl-CoA C-acetyltransferase n=1 Tax=Chloracidobacterium sp. N TaxID=2821540 RepID=A0ABX8AXV2_9BACT|nr:acetyl-CoA C-acetyltransferase [Chloracidobacterium aggregatum]QUV84107.1 acetyl-CoA C-acetyltransferase [Chloracidobacterium sp. 2]QUV87408.1 acetyl-CoA C-acetyltransferase [Chloracidobacterium sp. S]QUV90311.1 acetyl-CoA C-acetyltransferase [Chloracidobacterium sp. A]QUV93523.1 acetyl-CoA C-acetyltransferase [Chloracidobacterium sp. N]QUV96679.1 acetyl-CoA C-acetyltransferase [Chloracidobacterium sp. E]